MTPADVKSVVADLIASLEEVDASEVAESLLARRTTRSAPMRGHLQELVALRDIADLSVVRLRPRTSYNLGTNDSGEFVVSLPGRRLFLPASVAPAVRLVLDGQVHAVSELAHLLDEESRLVLVRRLVREGLLVTVGA